MEWFKMQTGWGDAVELLTDEEAGRVFKNIYAYALRKEVRTGEGRDGLLTAIMLGTLKGDIEKYENSAAEEERKKEQKRQHARHAARARWQQAQEGAAPGDGGQDAAAPGSAGHPAACGGHSGQEAAWQNKNKDTDKEKEKEKETEPEEEERMKHLAELLHSGQAADLPMIDGRTYPVFRKDMKAYAARFPDVNVEQELKKMVIWCGDNPSRCKTVTEMRPFIERWLDRAQQDARAAIDRERNSS